MDGCSISTKRRKKLIDTYRNNGWNILNIASAGSLGGNDIKWDDASLKKEALKYKTIKEFREKAHGAYSTALTKGFEKFGAHLTYERTYWDLEKVKKEALKYSTISDFLANGLVGAYEWAKRNNVSDEVFGHMNHKAKPKSKTRPKGIEKFGAHLKYERTYWNLEKVNEIAPKYTRKHDFRNQEASAYSWALRNKLVDEICSHMESKVQKWTLKKVMKVAENYDSMSIFQKEKRSAFEWARKSEFFEEICGKMKPLRKSWNLELVIEEAKKHSSKSEFQKRSGSAWGWAQRNKALEEVYKHLKSLKN
jgi:predicted house-cleaning noncanonical NTP pyrophosphatase (MazG superfamily)